MFIGYEVILAQDKVILIDRFDVKYTTEEYFFFSVPAETHTHTTLEVRIGALTLGWPCQMPLWKLRQIPRCRIRP